MLRPLAMAGLVILTTIKRLAHQKLVQEFLKILLHLLLVIPLNATPATKNLAINASLK
jgi:hypothetical protein